MPALRLPTVTYLMYLCNWAQSIFKDLKLEIDFSSFATVPQMAVSAPSVFMLLSSVSFQATCFATKNELWQFNSQQLISPILSLAPFFISLGWDAGFRADKNAVVVNWIFYLKEPPLILPQYLFLISSLPFTPAYLFLFALGRIPAQKLFPELSIPRLTASFSFALMLLCLIAHLHLIRPVYYCSHLCI